MNKIKKIISAFFALIFIAVTIFNGFAVTNAKGVSGVIKQMYVRDHEGNQINDVQQWEVFRLYAKFELPNNAGIKQGDTTTIRLPNTIRIPNHTTIELKSGANLVATADVDAYNGIVTLTYTDFVENNSDVKGEFFFNVLVDHENHPNPGIISLDLTVETEIVNAGNINFLGIENLEKSKIAKFSWQSSNSRVLYYGIRINTAQEQMNDLVIKDKLVTPGIKIKRDSLSIRKGKWVEVIGNWELRNDSDVTHNYVVNYSQDYRGFEIDAGNLTGNEGLYIEYQVEVPYEPANGEIFTNTVGIDMSNSGSEQLTNEYNYHSSGGSAEGYTFAIKLKKVSEDGTPLQGAKFEVVRKSSGVKIGEFETLVNGEVNI